MTSLHHKIDRESNPRHVFPSPFFRRRVHLPLSLLLPCGLIPLLVSCTTSLDLSQLETKIRDGIKTQAGVVVDSVSCPPGERRLAINDTFECEAKTTEGNLTVQVRQTDGKGNVSWQVTKGLFSLKTAEQKLQEAVERKIGLKVTVDCGSQRNSSRLGRKGATFNCNVTDGKQSLPLKITLEDDEGAFQWEPILR